MTVAPDTVTPCLSTPAPVAVQRETAQPRPTITEATDILWNATDYMVPHQYMTGAWPRYSCYSAVS